MADLTEKISLKQGEQSSESPSPMPEEDGSGAQDDDY